MIATIRSGIGSLVDQWFRGSRIRMGAMLTNDQQGCRDQLRPMGFADDSQYLALRGPRDDEAAR